MNWIAVEKLVSTRNVGRHETIKRIPKRKVDSVHFSVLLIVSFLDSF